MMEEKDNEKTKGIFGDSDHFTCENKTQEGLTIIPNWLLEDDKIQPITKLIIIRMLDNHSKGIKTTIEDLYLVARCTCIHLFLDELESVGYIDKEWNLIIGYDWMGV
jgi:hypothetical protein